MKRSNWATAFFTLGIFFLLVPILQKSFVGESSKNLVAQSNTYYGPIHPVVNENELVKVQILVRDSAEPSGLQIVSVQFDNQSIALMPRDIYGNRGQGSFQVKPGKYKLKWVVNRNDVVWPRQIEHESIVTVSPRDLWVQIEIEGEKATIS